MNADIVPAYNYTKHESVTRFYWNLVSVEIALSIERTLSVSELNEW